MEPPDELYALKTLDEKTLAAPESRVADAGSVRSICSQAVRDDEPRARLRALTKGLLDGNAPYKRKTSWQANLNFMEGEAAIDSARVPYYQLFSGVKEYATCSTNWKRQESPQECEQAGQKISKHFHKLLSGWNQFDWHMQNSQAEMLRWGFSPLISDPGGSWKYKSIDSKCLMFPRDSASTIDDRLPYLPIIEAFTVSELWDKIRDEDAATKVGWNVPAVKRAIQKAAAGTGEQKTPWSASPWEEWQRRLKNNDLYYTASGQMIYCYRLLVKEFRNGKSKISQFIVSQDPIFDEANKETRDNDAGFLFHDIDRYDSYDEALIVAWQNTGDGTAHSVRGMAMKGFKHWDASNRLKCKAMDNAFQRSSIVLSSDSVKSQDQMQLIVRTDMTMLPPGTKVEQMGFAGDIEGVMAVDRMLSNHLANNLGVYNQRTLTREDGRGEQPTATQVQMQVQKEATLSQGQITLYYHTLDTLYSQIFTKAVKSSEPDAVAFRKACEDDGVPEEALKDMACVQANRQSGYGSSAMRQLTLQQVQSVVQMLPEKGKVAFLDMWISSVAGVDKIDILNPKQHIPEQDDSIAAAENGSMAAGSPAIVSSGQNHVVHLMVHLDEMDRRLGPIRDAFDQEEPVDPAQLQEAFAFLSIMSPHLEEHLEPIESDPSRAQLARQFRAQVQEYVAFNGKLRSAIVTARRQAQIAAQEQQNATALGELDQAKVRSQQTSDAIKMDKWRTDKAIKLDKAATNSRLQTFKAAQSARIADVTAASSIQRENFKAAASASDK